MFHSMTFGVSTKDLICTNFKRVITCHNVHNLCFRVDPNNLFTYYKFVIKLIIRKNIKNICLVKICK
jgi:hypothetical protein